MCCSAEAEHVDLVLSPSAPTRALANQTPMIIWCCCISSTLNGTAGDVAVHPDDAGVFRPQAFRSRRAPNVGRFRRHIHPRDNSNRRLAIHGGQNGTDFSATPSSARIGVSGSARDCIQRPTASRVQCRLQGPRWNFRPKLRQGVPSKTTGSRGSMLAALFRSGRPASLSDKMRGPLPATW